MVIRPSLPRKGTFLSPPNSPRFVSAYFKFFLVLRGLVSTYHCYLTLNIANYSSYQTIAAGGLTSCPLPFFLSKVAAAYCVWTVLESCLLWVCPTCHRLWTWSVRFLWKITGRSGAVRLRACVDACRCIIERATSYSTAGQAWRLEPLWPCVFTSEIEHPCNTMMDYKIDLVLGTHLRVGVNACACGQFFCSMSSYRTLRGLASFSVVYRRMYHWMFF